MTEDYAESLYGANPEGDAPQGEELVTDPGDSPSYAVLSPTPPSAGRVELEEMLLNVMSTLLPPDPTKDDVAEAIGFAASVLWGAGYRKVLQ